LILGLLLGAWQKPQLSAGSALSAEPQASMDLHREIRYNLQSSLLSKIMNTVNYLLLYNVHNIPVNNTDLYYTTASTQV